MADTKISALAELTVGNVADGDLFVEVDVSDTTMAASGTDKKLLASSLKHYVTGATKTPATLTGSPTLVAWYKPESLTGTDGDLIGTWADSSGNAFDLTQATSGKKPVLKTARSEFNGYNVARFDGVDDTLIKTSTGLGSTSTMTGFAVFFHISGQPQVWDIRGSNYFDLYQKAGPKWAVRSPDAGAESSSINSDLDNGMFWAIVTMTGSAVVLWLKGEVRARVTQTGNVTPTNIYLCSNADAGAYANIDVAEFGVFTASLTSAQQRELVAYLSAKYGHIGAVA